MYKKRLRKWGLRKNNRTTRTRHIEHEAEPVDDEELPATPRLFNVSPQYHALAGGLQYLRQNDRDEELQNLLDILRPFTDQASSFYNNASRISATLPAYMYTDFTHYMNAATAAFLASQIAAGGQALRSAFLALEKSLQAPQPFILHSLFYICGSLASAGFFDIQRLLLTHAASMVRGRNDPVARILEGLDSVARRDDSALLWFVCFRVYTACHQLMGAGNKRSVGMWLCRRRYWDSVAHDRENAAGLVLGNLSGFQSMTESHLGKDHPAAITNLDEMVAVFAAFRCKEFEAAALDLKGRVERRLTSLESQDQEAVKECLQWRRNVNFELALHYRERGDMITAVEHLRQAIDDSAETAWAEQQREELESWLAQTAAL